MSVPFIPGNVVWKVEILTEYQASPCMHKFHFQNKTPIANALDICTSVYSEVIAKWMVKIQTFQVRYVFIRAGTVGWEVFTEQTLFLDDVFGEEPATGHSPVTSVVWQLRTDTTGRRGIGRIYHFGIPYNYGNTLNRLNDLGLNNHRTVATGFEHDFKLGGTSPMLTMGVFSEKAYSVSHDAADAFSPMKFINVHYRYTSCSKRRD